MSVRLTCPHPKHGDPGTLVSLDDPQAERDLITAGYAVNAYTRKAPAKVSTTKARKAAARKPAAKTDDGTD